MRDWRVATVKKVAAGVLWFFRLVKGWAPRVLGGASSFAFILWGANGDVWKSGLPVFVLGLLLAVAAFAAEFVVQNPSYMKLSQMREVAERKAQRKAEALERAIEIMLARLGSYCKLEGHSDRLSVYFFQDDRFFLVSRHAKNPTNRRRGRESYPADEGAIGAAWSADQGQALVMMPTGKDAWGRAAKKQGISPDAIAGIKMKSVGLGGYRLETSDGSVGVLIVESTTPNRINQDHIDLIAGSYIAAAVAELVATFALMTPAGETFEAAKAAAPRQLKWQSVAPRAPQAPPS